MDLVHGRGFSKIVFSTLFMRACVRPSVRPEAVESVNVASPKMALPPVKKVSVFVKFAKCFVICENVLFCSTLKVIIMRPTKNECTGGPGDPSGSSGPPVHSFLVVHSFLRDPENWTPFADYRRRAKSNFGGIAPKFPEVTNFHTTQK